MATVPDSVFDGLLEVIQQQKIMLQKIAEDLEAIESIGGGGGTATIEDYESGKNYKRNVLLVDTNTETVYRVLRDYTSVTVEDDARLGLIKLVGFESQIVTMNHNPTQAEIDALPDDTLVAVYSTNDTPYHPDE